MHFKSIVIAQSRRASRRPVSVPAAAPATVLSRSEVQRIVAEMLG